MKHFETSPTKLTVASNNLKWAEQLNPDEYLVPILNVVLGAAYLVIGHVDLDNQPVWESAV